MTAIDTDTFVTVYDPDFSFGTPAFDGEASDAPTYLMDGVYEAYDMNGTELRLTVEGDEATLVEAL